MSANVPSQSGNPTPFLLFEGGPFSRLLKPLSADRVNPPSIARSVALVVLLTWVPMAVLAALQDLALLPNRRDSFLLDAAMYARFWVAMPVLLLSPAAVGPRLRTIIQNFLDAGLVKDSELERFHANVNYAMRSVGSPPADILLLAFAYGHSAYMAMLSFPWMPSSWRSLGPAGELDLSWAGWWLVAVSQPVYSFAVLRLAYRIVVLWRFFWRTSRLDLQLIASHADGAGGLAFLGLLVPPLGVPAFALASGLAGGLANLVLWTGITVGDYRYTLVFFLVLIVALFAGPLLFFYLPLRRVRIQGTISYGMLERRQLRQFEQKWIESTEADAGILSAQDFSAVIDLHDTVAAVRRMRVVPLQRRQLLVLVASTLAPFLPVIALEIPVAEIIKRLMKLAM